MKVSTTACLLAGFVSYTSARGTLSLSLSKRDVNGQASPQAKGVYKRQVSSASTVEESLFDILPWSTGGAYYTNVTVGTPPQTLTVILDTGSSDLYLDASGAASCEATNAFNSCRGGSFNPGASSSYKVVDQGGFNTSFGDGSTATGDFSTDHVGIGDVVIQNVQLGVATEVDSTTGYAVSLMGLGYSANEASETPYPNMPEVLQQAGAINSRLYSVFLNELGEATGTILFGGIDTSKYTGELYTLDLLPIPISDNQGGTTPFVYEFTVAVTAVSSSVNGKNTSYFSGGSPAGPIGTSSTDTLPVLLDTGSSAWTVPTEYYNKFAEVFGSALDDEGLIACSHQNDDISFTVQFGGEVSVNVPARDLIVPVYDADTNKQNTTADGEPLCVFMISPDSGGQQYEESGFLTLGDAVLRSMYVVFDLDNGQVSIAQAIANASTDATTSGSGDNIKVIQAGVGGVASAVGSANGGVSTAAANTNTIDPQITASQSFAVSTVADAVATATGSNAIPEQGQVSATGSSASGSSGSESSSSTTSGSTSSSSSKGAASGLAVPSFEWTAIAVFGVWAGMATLGAGLII